MVEKSLILDFEDFHVVTKDSEWKKFWTAHGLSSRALLLKQSYIDKNILVLPEQLKSYKSSIISDFLRHKMLKTGETFSFESVAGYADGS